MIETGSAVFKNKLAELEEKQERLSFELAEIESALQQEILSENQIENCFIMPKNN